MSTLIQGARIIDGSGAPWFRGDVLFEAGQITAIGIGLATTGAEIIKAQDRYLAPGFIDAHCHDDLICLREPARTEKVRQGVTTVVTGNCSFSLFPTVANSRTLLRRHFSALLGEVAPDEVFDSVNSYRVALAKHGIGVNLVPLLGHAALRFAIMGETDRAANATERTAMQSLLAQELRAGAAGLSLGLVYPPSAFADTAELVALAKTVQAEGKLLTAHIRSYEGGLVDSIDEFLSLLKQSGAAGLLSHLQAAGRPNWGKIPSALRTLEAARVEGIDVAFDMYPYMAGSSYALQLLPPSALADGVEALCTKLGDVNEREKLRRAVEEAPDAKVALIGWHNIRIAGVTNPALKSFEGQNMQAASASAGTTPFDLFCRLVREDAGQTAIIMFQLDEADLHAACTHSLHMVGSDGLPRPGTRPHPRAYGTFPRVVGPLRRESKWFSLEDAVRRMTSVPAQRFALMNRGLVRPGMAADLVLFDEQVSDRATFDDPIQPPNGICDVWLAGIRTIAAGHATGARPGQLLGGSIS